MNALLFLVPNAVHGFPLAGASWSVSCLPSTMRYVTGTQIRSAQDLEECAFHPHFLEDEGAPAPSLYTDSQAQPHLCIQRRGQHAQPCPLLFFQTAHPRYSSAVCRISLVITKFHQSTIFTAVHMATSLGPLIGKQQLM